MSQLILVRHGQSIWNLEKRFTGWVDVDLTAQGKLEACKSGELIKELKIPFNHFFCSYQKRAIHTLELILNIRERFDFLIKTYEEKINEIKYFKDRIIGPVFNGPVGPSFCC